MEFAKLFPDSFASSETERMEPNFKSSKKWVYGLATSVNTHSGWGHTGFPWFLYLQFSTNWIVKVQWLPSETGLEKHHGKLGWTNTMAAMVNFQA